MIEKYTNKENAGTVFIYSMHGYTDPKHKLEFDRKPVCNTGTNEATWFSASLFKQNFEETSGMESFVSNR